MLIPDLDQKKVIDSVSQEPSKASLLACGLGTGKTVMAVEILKNIDPSRTLIIAPKSTFGFEPTEFDEGNGWIGTLRRQGYEGPITVVKDRDDVKDGPGLWIIGREAVSAYTRKTKKKEGLDWSKVEKYDLVIYDEVHFIGNRKSESFNTIVKIRSDWRIGLSGTPFRSSFNRIWAVCRWLWPDKVRKSYWSWHYDYVKTEKVYREDGTPVMGPGGKQVEKITGEKNPGEYVSLLPNYHRIESTENRTLHTIEVDLSATQRRMYDRMEQDAMTYVQDDMALASIPIHKRLMLREITLGVPSEVLTTTKVRSKDGSEYESDSLVFSVPVKSTKMDALMEYLGDYDPDENPVLIGTHSKKFALAAIERIRKTYPSAELWTGDTKQSERDEIKKRFFSGESSIVLCTPHSFGTGTDGFQHRASTIIFLSRTESITENDQFIGRLDRRGQKSKNVRVIDIIGHNTYDRGQLSDHAMRELEVKRSLKRRGNR